MMARAVLRACRRMGGGTRAGDVYGWGCVWMCVCVCVCGRKAGSERETRDWPQSCMHAVHVIPSADVCVSRAAASSSASRCAKKRTRRICSWTCFRHAQPTRVRYTPHATRTTHPCATCQRPCGARRATCVRVGRNRRSSDCHAKRACRTGRSRRSWSSSTPRRGRTSSPSRSRRPVKPRLRVRLRLRLACARARPPRASERRFSA